MVSLDDAIMARLESHGETFEILLDPKVVDLVKQGKEFDIVEYMAVEDVFKNASKGTKPAEDKIKEAFGTDDIGEIARKIVEKGEIHITAEQRKEMLEAKKQQVIAFIAANAINPQTHTPHPPLRIQLALEEAKFHVDPFKPLQKEIDEAMKLLRPLLPIRFEKARIAVKLNGADYGRCYDDIIHYGIVEREEWTADGSWIGVMEVPGGLTNEIADKLKHKTKGTASVKLIN
ncbi:MAG: ribosome assembly factor SBDS [Candidatus Methanomethylophilaceae archaeon]|jgi:ribosome maturation protein SDO1|nr:ribosome assembly factor SBDS [Candidatus Methanomethylophilaceae archaeon]